MKDYKKSWKLLKNKFSFFDISLNQFLQRVEKVKGYREIVDYIEAKVRKIDQAELFDNLEMVEVK